MEHITGISRNQLSFSSLEDIISPDNQVRFLDAFVDHLDLAKLGFAIRTLKSQGRPGYKSTIFLKLYLYGYLNGIRSSRKLETCPKVKENTKKTKQNLPQKKRIQNPLENLFKNFTINA